MKVDDVPASMKYGINCPRDATSPERGDNGLSSDEETRDVSQGTSSRRRNMANSSPINASPGLRGAASAADIDAVVFSIQFYGKTIGELGLMDQDLSQLDWKKFKSYLFQNLLSMSQQENICVSYNDEEGDKLPIESDEEYREALKVAKKKAETHDKLVLDITRQGGLPTVLSFVSSGIKKVSSSPPKEGGISFFKASSPPKDNVGLSAKVIGTERKLFPGFFMPDKGPVPKLEQGMWGYDCDEAVECDKPLSAASTATTSKTATTSMGIPTQRTDCKKGPPVRALRNSPPNLLFKFEVPTAQSSRDSLPLNLTTSRDVFGAGNGELTSGGARPKVFRKDFEDNADPPEWFTTYMEKFRRELQKEITSEVMEKMDQLLQERKATVIASNASQPSQRNLNNLNKQSVDKAPYSVRCEKDQTEPQVTNACSTKKGCFIEENLEAAQFGNKCKKKIKEKVENVSAQGKKMKAPKVVNEADTGAKRKKVAREEERLARRQEKVERKKLASKLLYCDELDRASRTQEKVLAKMEGLRKKQSCSPEELNKIRKIVDKQHRVFAAEQRQQRRNERKAGNQKAGKSKKINIDSKGFPVDASLLHAALQELEALAEDSPSEGNSGMTTRGFDALYIKDVTYPDGSEVAPGKEFVKTWRVANSGVLPWNEKTTLCKWSQVRFRGSPAGWKLKPSLKKVVCPPLEPGQEGEISITFTAPSEPGWYATHWRFCQRGRVFGNQMWCAIHVVDPSSREVQQPRPQKGLVVQDEEPVDLINRTTDLHGTRRYPHFRLEEDLILFEEDGERVQLDISSLELAKDGLQQDDAGATGEQILNEMRQTNPEFILVEDYYDAEDPVPLDLSKRSEGVLSPRNSEKMENDLLLCDEDVVILSSEASTPDLIENTPQPHSVVPLKEIAKESVDLLRESQAKQEQREKTCCEARVTQADVLSISSGSFSELDSEDQAIMNESDTECSEHEYFVVDLPECFNTLSLYDETERPDSPDFLTADEDDRTTAVASEETLEIENIVAVSSNFSREGSHSDTVTDSSSSQTGSTKTVLPKPPTDTKPFMEIPAEALRTNLSYAVLLSGNAANSEQSECPQQQQQQQHEKTTWASKSEETQEVVCEQPSSAQHKEPTQAVSKTQEEQESDSPSSPTPDLPGDLVGALPDELVSIIPEDLVRGAWNTARSFITRINQEMLSPSAESSGRVYHCEEVQVTGPTPEPVSTASQPQQEHTPQEPQTTEQSDAASPLAPPMQQLEDMGFSNREVNQRLLTKYNNNVSCAVAELIVLNYQ